MLWALLALGCISLIWKTFYKLYLNRKGGWGLKVYIIGRWIKLRYKISIRLHSTDFAPKEVDYVRLSFQGRLLIRTSRIVVSWLWSRRYIMGGEQQPVLPDKVQDRKRHNFPWKYSHISVFYNILVSRKIDWDIANEANEILEEKSLRVQPRVCCSGCVVYESLTLTKVWETCFPAAFLLGWWLLVSIELRRKENSVELIPLAYTPM